MKIEETREGRKYHYGCLYTVTLADEGGACVTRHVEADNAEVSRALDGLESFLASIASNSPFSLKRTAFEHAIEHAVDAIFNHLSGEGSSVTTYVLEVLYGHEMVGPDYALVDIDHEVANVISEKFGLMDEAADEYDNLREMVYSTFLATWVESGELSDLFEGGTDVLTGDPFEEAMETNQIAAVNRPLTVEPYHSVECEMMHIKENRVLWSAYVDGCGDGLETACIPRREIEEMARTCLKLNQS